MNKCSYCGRDNTEDALNCCECGTEIKRTSEVPLPEESKHLESSPIKSSKQLANVLIKVLGLSVCLQGIPSFVAGFLRGFLSALHSEPTRRASASDYSWTYAVGSAVYLAIGIFLILRSRYIAGKLFKNED
jgi:hypothetical protein